MLPFFSLDHLRRLIPNLDSLLGWPDQKAMPTDYSVVVPVLAPAAERLASRKRGWRSYSGGFHPSESLVFLAEAIGSTMLEQSATTEAKGLMQEETTKTYLIDPVLRLLGWHHIQAWHGLNYEHRLSNNLRPDAFAGGVCMEFKRNDPLFDQLDASNKSNNAYATIAQQAAAYHEALEVNCVIYSNGRFWWRLEYDEDIDVFFALRFNMHTALNNYRNSLNRARLSNNGIPYRSRELENFVSMFHASAFFNGNNFIQPVHQGWVSHSYGDIGPVWLKDLNRGWGG